MAEFKIYGIIIKTDENLPLNSWYFDTAQMQELARHLLDLDRFLRANNMRARGLLIGQ